MNIILKIILFNLILIYSLIYNNKLLCLLIILFSMYILYTYYYINNVIEGNTSLDDYKMNFAGLLNKSIKTSYKEEILYDRILNNFTNLLNLMNKADGYVPPTQMCKGELGDWSDCSKTCGRGNKTRQFKVDQKAGVDGIDCIYEDGQIETKECFERLCKFNEPCKDNFDCISNYCSKSEKICTYPHMCTRGKLYNCNAEQCNNLNTKYGSYIYDTQKQRCINKYIDLTVNKLTDNQVIYEEVKKAQKKSTDNEHKIEAIFLEEYQDTMCDKDNVSSCSDLDNVKCNNSKGREDDNIYPCYYDDNVGDNVGDNGECKSITEKYDRDEWKSISFNFQDGTDKNKDKFFNCPVLVKGKPVCSESQKGTSKCIPRTSDELPDNIILDNNQDCKITDTKQFNIKYMERMVIPSGINSNPISWCSKNYDNLKPLLPLSDTIIDFWDNCCKKNIIN